MKVSVWTYSLRRPSPMCWQVWRERDGEEMVLSVNDTWDDTPRHAHESPFPYEAAAKLTAMLRRAW